MPSSSNAAKCKRLPRKSVLAGCVILATTLSTSALLAGIHLPMASFDKAPNRLNTLRQLKQSFTLAQSDNGADPQAIKDQLDLAFWNSIKDSDNPGLYRAYLKKFPRGNFAIIAREKLKALGGTPQNDDSTDTGQASKPAGDGSPSADTPDRAETEKPHDILIAETGIGTLDAKTPFKLKAVSKRLGGLKFTKQQRPGEEGGVTVFTAKTADGGQVIVSGADKVVYSVITSSPRYVDVNNIRVGDSFAKLAGRVKLERCLSNPFPEVYDQPDKMVCFNQRSNLAYWFKLTPAQLKGDLSPEKMPKDSKISNLQWAAISTPQKQNNADTNDAKDKKPQRPQIVIEDDASNPGQPDQSATNNPEPQDDEKPSIDENSPAGLIARGDEIIARSRAEGGNRTAAAKAAFRLYNRALKRGSARAAYKIGRLYEAGFQGGSTQAARKFYTRAGRAGFSPAFVRLINMLDRRGQTKPAANVLLLFYRTSPRAAINSLRRYQPRVLRAMQIRLRNTGFYAGPIDGAIGSGTQRAMRDFGRAKGALRKAPLNQPRTSPQIEYIKRAQRNLRRLGCYSGPIDGIWGSGTARAVRNFNRWTGGPRISETTLNDRTLNVLHRARAPVCGAD